MKINAIDIKPGAVLEHQGKLWLVMKRELVQNCASDFVAVLGRLVGIGSSAERNGFVGLYASEFVTQEAGGILLHVNLLLELHAISHFHKLMGVARVAVAATEFAAAVRIDRPGERHLTATDAAVQQRLRRKSEVFNIVPFAQRLALGREPRNTD